MAWEDLDRPTRKALRELADVARRKGETRHLEDLALKFDAWRAGTLDNAEIQDAIHRYYQGPSKDWSTRYWNLKPDVLVALALANGILDPDDIPEDLRAETVRRADLIKRGR